MNKQDWLTALQKMARGERMVEALKLFDQHKDEAVDMLFGEQACASSEQLCASGKASAGDSLFERDTREIAQLVAKWSIYALPLTEDVLEITVDVSQQGEPPLVTARVESGEVFLFDVNEASRANEAHLEDCRHVEASWGDWQDHPDFLPLFCRELTAALTAQGLPEPAYLR